MSKEFSLKRFGKLLFWSVVGLVGILGLWQVGWYFGTTHNGKYKLEQLRAFPQEYQSVKSQYLSDFYRYQSVPLWSGFDWDAIGTDESVQLDVPATIFKDNIYDPNNRQGVGVSISMDEALGYKYVENKRIAGFVLRLEEPNKFLMISLYHFDDSQKKPLLLDLVLNAFGSYRDGWSNGGQFNRYLFMGTLRNHDVSQQYGENCLQFVNITAFANQTLPSNMVADNCRVMTFKQASEDGRYYRDHQPNAKTYLELQVVGTGDAHISIQKMELPHQ